MTTRPEGQAMVDEFVHCRTEGRITRVELDRADAANRITMAMMQQFIDALAKATSAESDVLLITAVGPDFSVGRDQQEVLPDGVTRRDGALQVVEANRLLRAFPGITVASARGRALGFGCGVLVQADLAIVADTAHLGFDEIRHGIAPAFVMAYLEDNVGRKRALDLILTGRMLTAHEAQLAGMVSRVVTDEALEASTEALVDDLLRSDRALLTKCKSYLRDIQRVPLEERSERALSVMFGGAERR